MFKPNFPDVIQSTNIYLEDKTFFSVYQRLSNPSVIMCCSPNCEAVRAATHYYTRALQTSIHGKECNIVIVFILEHFRNAPYLYSLFLLHD